MAVVMDLLIYSGTQDYHSAAIASSIGLSAFALMLIIAAYESRSVTRTLRECGVERAASRLTPSSPSSKNSDYAKRSNYLSRQNRRP